MSRFGRRTESGSVTVVAAAVLFLAGAMVLVAVDFLRVVQARGRAQTAADAAALAAAQEMALPSGRTPEQVAAEYAERNGGTLSSCECDQHAREAIVQVEVPVDLVFVGADRTVRASARAVIEGPSHRTRVEWPPMLRMSDARSGRRPAHSSTGGRRRRGKAMGVVDYTLAKRALLRDFRRGLLSRFEICDAHPELIRAARYLGAEASRPCPVCGGFELRLLAYVYADGLQRNNGRAFEVEEGLKLVARQRGGACYVVEVCTNCSWNHLSEAFLAHTG